MCYDCMQYCGIEKILDSSELVEGISLYLIKFECNNLKNYIYFLICNLIINLLYKLGVSFLNTYWISEEQAEKIGQRKIKISGIRKRELNSSNKSQGKTTSMKINNKQMNYRKNQRIIQEQRELQNAKDP